MAATARQATSNPLVIRPRFTGLSRRTIRFLAPPFRRQARVVNGLGMTDAVLEFRWVQDAFGVDLELELAFHGGMRRPVFVRPRAWTE